MAEGLETQNLDVEALRLQQKKDFKKFLTSFIRKMKDENTREQIIQYLRMGRPDLVVKYVTDQTDEFNAAILAAFISGANFETRNLLGLTTGFNISYSFNMTDRFAIERLSQVQSQFIDDFNRSTRKLLDTLFVEQSNQISNPETTADYIQLNFGLTERSYEATENYRRLLENLSSQSLDRELRSSYFDETVIAAIAAHKPLTANQIERMVAAYRRNSILSRIEQMSETSSGSFVEAGRESSAEQFDRFLIPFGFETVKEWRSRRDSKVRYTHTHASLDGQVVKENDVFLSSSGARLFYPRDSRAPMRETVNCRCNLLRYIRPIKI